MKTAFALFFLLSITLLQSQTPRLVVPIGHTDAITSVAFSPDGNTILTGSRDKTAKLWDLAGRELQTFKGHTSDVTSVTFSPDGKTALTGGDDGSARLWDLAGQELSLYKHSKFDRVTAVAFSPDGKTVLTAGEDGAAKLWDLAGQRLANFSEDYGDKITSVVFSPDGEIFLTGSSDSTAKLWDVSGYAEFDTLEGHAGVVTSVAFSPDGGTVLTGSEDSTAILWDVMGRVRTFKGHAGAITSVAFSPDGKTILTGSWDGTARLWDLTGKALQTFKGHNSVVHSVAFSPDGKTILTGSSDGTARLWDLSGRNLQTFKGNSDRVLSVALPPASPDDPVGGKSVLTGSSDNRARLWGLSGRAMQTFKGHNSAVNSIAYSPDGKSVLTGSYDKTAMLWDLAGKALQTFTGHAGAVTSVAYSPDGKSVLTGSYDSTAMLWDLAGKALQTFKGHADRVNSVAFSPDGKTVLTGSKDETAILWDLTGKALQIFTGFADEVYSVAFSPDGKTVLTGSLGDTAKLWDLTGQVLQTFKSPYNLILSVAFSPDGKKVLAGCAGGTAILWDLTGQVLQSFKGHSDMIYSVAYSPDGKTILTGSIDNTAKLWDARTGRELATLIAIDSSDWVATSPSGLFDASPGAMSLMHYVVGLEVIELEQLKERYYEPNLLAKVMGYSDEPLRSVSGFDSIALYPNVGLQLDTLKNKLHIRLQPRNGGTGKVSVFINGKEIIPEANPEKGYEKNRDTTMTIELDRFQNYFLFDSLNVVSARAYNQSGWLKSAPKSVTYRPAFARSKGTDKGTGSATTLSLNRKPTLFAVVVGTADYTGSQLDLKYSAKDAQDMASALEQIGAQLFGKFGPEHISVQLLSTDTSHHAPLPTKANIRAAFDSIKTRARAEDILVVYFSGHGVSYGDADKALFYYLTMDIASENLSDAGVRAGRTVSSEELTRWINDIPAQKQVLILDACNSGRVVENMTTKKDLNSSQIRALDRMKDRTGMFVLTGSAADKVSYEAGQYGQGLLTFSLLQGIKGLALTDDKRVDVNTLFQWAREQVPVLAKGIGGVQKPMLVGPSKGSFDIGVVNENVHIPLEEAKPVFIRNIFQDSLMFHDVLGLTKALKEYFQLITVQRNVDLVYVDVSEYENAYSIKGRYSIDGEDVNLIGRLFKGEEPVGEPFRVSGKKDNIQGLVEGIVEKVSGML